MKKIPSSTVHLGFIQACGGGSECFHPDPVNAACPLHGHKQVVQVPATPAAAHEMHRERGPGTAEGSGMRRTPQGDTPTSLSTARPWPIAAQTLPVLPFNPAHGVLCFHLGDGMTRRQIPSSIEKGKKETRKKYSKHHLINTH